MPEIRKGVPRRLERRLQSTIVEDIRVDVLRLLEERAMSIRQLAETFEERLSAVAPHVLELWREGSIDIGDDDGVALADRRFRIRPELVDKEEWVSLTSDEQYEVAVRVLQGVIGEAMSALRSGHLTSRSDTHLSWMPMAVDEEGWRETTAMLERTFREANAIKVRCAERLRASGDRGTSIIFSMMGFERSR